MNDIINIIISPNDSTVQVAAFHTLQKLFEYESIGDARCDEIDNSILPSILRIYFTSTTLAIKYSATCLLRSLSMHKSTSNLLESELLLILKQFKDSSSMLKEVFTQILINLHLQQGLVDMKLLDTSLLPTCSNLICDGPCTNQTMALSLLSSLLQEEKYIHNAINHQYLIPSILKCLQMSDCKKVRETAARVISHVTHPQQTKVANDFMFQTALYFAIQDGVDCAESKLLYPVRLKYQTDEKLWKAMDQFFMLISRSFTNEAKLMTSSDGNVSMDCNDQCDMSLNQLGSLTHLSSILSNLCAWPVKPLKSTLHSVHTEELAEDEEIRYMLSKINHQITIKIWYKVGLQLMAVLQKYCTKLQINPDVSPKTDISPRFQSSCLSEVEYELVLNIMTVLSFICVATFAHHNNKTDNTHRIVKPPASKTKIWEDDNPHLTGSIDRSSAIFHCKVEDELYKQQEEGKLIRNDMYQQGLIQVLSPFLESINTKIRIMSSFILRCSVQPLDKSEERELRSHPPDTKTLKRPQSAMIRTNKHKIDLALYKMSPELSTSMRNILEPRSTSALHKEIHQAKIIDEIKPISQLYRQSAVRVCGPRLLSGIFSKSRDVKKSSLLLIQDIVKYGTVETHMELSQLGCIPKLIDFLRINEDDEMLEISGLILTKMLICSDFRLKQLFNRHGGSTLLMAMAQYAKGKLRDEVRSTLQTVTQGDDKPKRPNSAPSSRTKTPDVWDHIMGRWKQEDEVVQVLRKWMKEGEQVNN